MKSVLLAQKHKKFQGEKNIMYTITSKFISTFYSRLQGAYVTQREHVVKIQQRRS